MLTATKQATKANVPVFIGVVVILVLYGLLNWAGPRLERQFFPPVDNVAVSPIPAPTVDEQAFILTGDTPRNCDFVYLTMGDVDPDGDINGRPIDYHMLDAPAGKLAMYVSVAAGGAEQIAGEAVFHCPYSPWGVSRVSIKTPAGNAFRDWNTNAPAIAVK